ncbi:IS3 family transposase [Zobellella denitrificans]|nr:IS3 family transposase [Zobellella denitrificans]OXS14587.1 IS3 family transposase [Zobellella denitrificans]
MSQKKAYTAEFKEAAVKLAVESKQSVNQTARELEVNVNTLHTWIAKYHRQQSTKGDGKVGEQHLYEELKQLRRENARLKEERELLKKAAGLLRQRISLRYAFIDANQGQFSTALMCRVFEVSRSSYYEWRSRPPSPRKQQEKALKAKIRKHHEEGRATYGTRRIQKKLTGDGEAVSRRRVARLMKEEGLACKTRRKFKATTNSKHDKPVAPNLLARHFSAEKPDQAYVGDITYIPTREGWLYLAVFIDLCSRAVVGWSMGSRMPASLVSDALSMAIWKRRPAAGLLVHSDRGSQYASDSFQRLLKQHDFKCSMSRKGNCWDNAPSESFFHTLKTELIYHEDFTTREEAKQAIFEYIEVFYNRLRLHSSNDYMSPLGYESELRAVA